MSWTTGGNIFASFLVFYVSKQYAYLGIWRLLKITRANLVLGKEVDNGNNIVRSLQTK